MSLSIENWLLSGKRGRQPFGSPIHKSENYRYVNPNRLMARIWGTVHARTWRRAKTSGKP